MVPVNVCFISPGNMSREAGGLCDPMPQQGMVLWMLYERKLYLIFVMNPYSSWWWRGIFPCFWFPRNIFWSDEPTFIHGGLFDVHNSHHYKQDTPHSAASSSFQHQENMNVGWGVVDQHLITTCILPSHLNAKLFRQLLKTWVLPWASPTNTSSIWFQMVAHHGTMGYRWRHGWIQTSHIVGLGAVDQFEPLVDLYFLCKSELSF